MRRKTHIDQTAEVHPDAVIGEGTMIWNWTKVRETARIGTNCNIGQCVYIDKGVSVGDDCKIQNGVSIYDGVTIGNRVFVGPSVTFINDRFPRAHKADWKVVPTVVEDGVSVGANSTIICGVTLGSHSMIAAGAVATRDVPPHALVMGQPARIVDYVTARGARLHHDMSGPPPAPDELNPDHV